MDRLRLHPHNNSMAKLFGFTFRSDRAACIRPIREIGLEAHADSMSAGKRQSIRK